MALGTTTLKHQRRFSFSFSTKLTSFRKPQQAVPHSQAEHGKVEMVVPPPQQPEQTLDQPHHYHNHRTEQQNFSMPNRQPRVHFAGSPSYTSQQNYSHEDRHRSNSQSSASSSYRSQHVLSSNNGAGTNSNPVSVASSRSSFEIEPSGPVAEWCHQMHIMQARKYDWCSACFPRPVPVRDEAYVEATEEVEADYRQSYQQAEEDEWARREKLVRRVRESRSATHAYQ
ncbi:uncharacterized protein AB675_3526 [Cyphellophora attinorum]|uniref:Uncharacterized protein n=1 Tax=Cyphellophora attinorum TaxID=1664694 RepID=A0A0N1HT13_9EURO|nr:uncharacterized protein AB675_3526 [Phialophora attinorum]KPI39532.1 hypothetical protein AB675_3526 [Phialophora attinorum]